MRILVLFAAALLTACQIKPTETRTTTEPSAEVSASDVLAKNPVILDARAPLDYGVSHVPGAINVGWMDFTLPGGRKGLLDPDDFALARRLALWGVDPETPVLVIGFGPRGDGAEGWIGWMLKSLGVKTVHLGTPAQYRGQIPRGESRPANKPMWKPTVRAELRATPAEGRAYLAGPSSNVRPMTKARVKALQGAALPPSMPRRRVVLDVRSTDEIKALPLALFGWTGVTAAIPWRDFFGEDGRPTPAAKTRLAGVGLKTDDEILVVSENGLEGGAVAFALDAIGFERPIALNAGLRGIGAPAAGAAKPESTAKPKGRK